MKITDKQRLDFLENKDASLIDTLNGKPGWELWVGRDFHSEHTDTYREHFIASSPRDVIDAAIRASKRKTGGA